MPSFSKILNRYFFTVCSLSPNSVATSRLLSLDAMGAGLCVLASDTAENREVIQDAGFTFRRGDVCELKRMLELLLSNPQLRSSAGRRAQAHVRRNYSWDEVAREIERTYLELTRQSKRAEAARAT
jgi:glycosyltransferase involved in cell wall biosynthesis